MKVITQIPTVPFGAIEITRLIVGGNPFCGHSHWSEERSREMREYFTPKQVIQTLHRCQALGVNTFQGRGDYHRVLHWLELFRREGGKLHWIAQTASEMHDVEQNIRICAAAGAAGIYHHGSVTDSLWKQGKQRVVRDRLQAIRDTGARVGLGTHMPKVIEYAEEHDWDVDFYMASLFNLSRIDRDSPLVTGGEYQEEPFYDEDPPRMCETIRSTPKQCLAFKVLGAGRLCSSQDAVAQAFRFAFDNIKPSDAVVVGVFPKDEEHVALNVDHVLAALK